MPRLFKRMSKKAGLSPGTLVHIGNKTVETARIRITDYDKTHFQEREAKNIEECFPFKEKPTVTWINIDGLHQVEIIEKLGNHFGVHPLVLEDILNTGQRPKLEDYGDYFFVVLKMLDYDQKSNEITLEQLSIILGSNYIISFQERVGDVFNPIRERIKNPEGRIRNMGADYLAYALIDAVVDNYFIILEKLGENIESIEEELVTNPTPRTLHVIHNLKREMILLRKSVWPLRELISGLEKRETTLIRKSTGIYLRDVYDHTIQVMDTIEAFRDMLSGMLDIYLSSISNRMNAVMKVLTVIATIFIPLTFVAGVYGMNFKYMPELDWNFGYFTVLGIMALIALVMVFYFKKKHWF